MTQPNIQADGVRIEPGSGQTLTITRDAVTGSLKFVDAVVTGGINLSQLAGLGTVAGTLIVGVSGTGAQYTTVQSAINAVPVTASLANPYVILVMPGVYNENLVIEKAGITVQGLGRVVIQATAVSGTVTVQEAVASVPTSLTLRDLVIVNANNGEACVDIVGGAGSTVGADGILLDGCDLRPTGVGGYTVYADTVNYVTLRDCHSDGVPGTASMRVSQCAGLTVVGGSIPLVQSDYNSAGTTPSVLGSAYSLIGCASVGNVLSTLTGAGSMSISSCPVVGSVTMNGNRTLTVAGSALGNVTVNGTSAATLSFSTRRVVAGAGTLLEPQTSGTVSFVASLSEPVAFDVARPNANYTVALDTGDVTTSVVASKANGGFTVTFAAPVTTTVYWTALSQ